jgi:phosphoglycolate phosphatase
MSALKPAVTSLRPDLSGVRAALIDLDGTMVDTALDLHDAVNRIRAEFSLPPLSVALIRQTIGKGSEHLVRQSLLVDKDAIEVERMMADAMAYFQQHYAITNGTRSTLYPDVIEGLELFKRKGLQLACVTNKPSPFTKPLMDRMGLTPYFDALWCADMLPKKKPDPLPMIMACERFGIEPLQAVVIGDSVNDALAARAAGCRLLNVPYGYNHGRSVQELGADGIVETLLEAAQLVE